MLFKKTISLILCVVMLTCAVSFGQSALYCAAFPDSAENDIEYITPEDFGAAGDGVTDDTDAIERCMKSETKEVYLTGEYLISRYIFSPYEKHFFAPSAKKAKIICDIPDDTKALAFYGASEFDNIIFESTLERTGTSAHGEKYEKTSNVVLTEIWENGAVFSNCGFINGLTAIRGRKSTDSDVIPGFITVNNCSFTDCKIPVQGYSRVTQINSCSFYNDGDLYGGDHCVYIERFGCESLTVTDTFVSTLNSESGNAFQIYGSPSAGDIVPSLNVSNCKINANGVASVSEADVIIRGTEFHASHPSRYIATAVEGSISLYDSDFTHSYAFTYAGTQVKPVAENCFFTLDSSLSQTRCNYPFESKNCSYINWGGNIRLDGTSFISCRFSGTDGSVLNDLYVRDVDGFGVSFTDCAFEPGAAVINDESAVTKWENCTVDGSDVSPHTDVPAIEIKNFKPSVTVDYKSALVFHTEFPAPPGYKIVWSNADEGTQCRIDRAERDEYRISAKLVRISDGASVNSTQTETVRVKTDFFSKIIAFFRQIFGRLPVYEDNIRL